MKVKINDVEYVVHFSYSSISSRQSNKVSKKGNGKRLKVTCCHVNRLNDVEGDGPVITEKRTCVGTGKAVQHYNDRENSVIGRKIAFTRAISEFNKEDRSIFWKEYKKTTRYR